MASDVDVASLALIGIGSEPITSLDPPDNNVRAKTVAKWFNEARDSTLRAHPWNFAITRDSVAADTLAPVWGYKRTFQLPNDCLRLLEVNGEDRSINSWRVEKGLIHTDLAAPAEIRYIAQITDAEAWDSLFVEAMAAHLGSLIAEKLTGLASMTEMQTTLFAAKLSKARAMDGFEQTPEDTDDTNDYTWLAVRYGY